MDRRKFLRLAAAAPLVAAIPPSAYAEGSRMGVVLPAVPLDGERAYFIGYREAVRGYEHVYPTLAQATRKPLKLLTNPLLFWDELGNDVAVRPTIGPPVGYRIWSGYEESLIRRSQGRWNAAQILRNPYGISGTSRHAIGGEELLRKLRKENLHQHLAGAENVLRHGVRSRTFTASVMLSFSGGIKQFGAGELRLRPLRDLCLLTNRDPNSYTYKEEFLGEFTLQVV